METTAVCEQMSYPKPYIEHNWYLFIVNVIYRCSVACNPLVHVLVFVTVNSPQSSCVRWYSQTILFFEIPSISKENSPLFDSEPVIHGFSYYFIDC
ncbi:unnamed protein product [Arabis nemorensis]|uniref:Uncharacterized protein n=1 Tax=Arabis nemorensis TaxID=586526 RepID=A0A565BUS5_9BRAS|nr:unnamed protein product [Arabis nemorensis]